MTTETNSRTRIRVRLRNAGLGIALLFLGGVVLLVLSRQSSHKNANPVSPGAVVQGGVAASVSESRDDRLPIENGNLASEERPQLEFSPTGEQRQVLEVRSSLGIMLEDIEVRNPQAARWQPTTADQSEPHKIDLDPSVDSLEIRAKAHSPQLIGADTSICILDPVNSMTLVFEGSISSIVREWKVCGGINRESPLRKNLDRAVLAGPSARGLSVAIDVDLFEEVLGSGSAAELHVKFHSGYDVKLTWRPAVGQQLSETVASEYLREGPSKLLAVSITPMAPGMAADEEELFDCALFSVDASTSIVLDRPWGHCAIAWRGVDNVRAAGASRVEFPGTKVGHRYCVVASGRHGQSYGRVFFTFDGSEVVLTPVWRNRLAGRLLDATNGTAITDDVSIQVAYAGTQYEALHGCSDVIMPGPGGTFAVNACSDPFPNEGVPFPAPKQATVKITAPGYSTWESQVIWPNGTSVVDLGAVGLWAGTPDLVLRPLPINRDDKWHAIFYPGGRREIIVRSAVARGELVSLLFEEASWEHELNSAEALLIPKGPLYESISGFVRNDPVCIEVAQSGFEVSVAASPTLQSSERLSLGIEWMGVVLPFGTFDAADFRNEAATQRFSFVAPEVGLMIWGQRVNAHGVLVGVKKTIALTPGAQNVIL